MQKYQRTYAATSLKLAGLEDAGT